LTRYWNDSGHFVAVAASIQAAMEAVLGVAQHFMTAVSWYRRAADQGNTAAQLNLGIMYDNGWGVAQNYVIAHMWFSLAAAMGDRDAARSQDVAAAKMTPAQLAEAQRLAREWEPKSTPS